MKRIASSIAALLAATLVNAQIYEWKDAQGKPHYSDKPPVGAVRAQQIGESTAAPATSAEPQSTAERELDYRKRQKEAQEKAAQDKEKQVAAADKKEACDSARRLLETLESGERIAQRDDSGERYYLDDAQRQQEATRTRQIMQSACSP